MHRGYGSRDSYTRRDDYDSRGPPPPYDRERGYDRYDVKRDRAAPYDRPRGTNYHRDVPDEYPRYRDEPPRYRDEPPRYREGAPRYRDAPPRYRDEPPRYRDDPPRYRDEPEKYRDDPGRYRDEPARYRDEPPRYRDEPPRYREGNRYRDNNAGARSGPVRRYDDRPSNAETPKSKVFVGNLDGKVSEEDLTNAFSKFGPINKIDYRRNFAFVDFVKSRDAEVAMREMNERVLLGTKLKVVPHSERSKRSETNREPDFASQATVLNLDNSASWQDLKDFARQAGEVVYASVIIRDQKRYGLVEFTSPKTMKAAVEQLNGKKIAVNELQVIPMAVNDYLKDQAKHSNNADRTAADQQLDEREDDYEEKNESAYQDEQLDSVDYD
ncbi:RNA recognition motif domain containing protein [Babesia bovis T2Bo]|uniref:RNA recognition motif containing protein n=1 Tax=Babesia bovis TaxID=5865 RepID=A7AR55_BABBO|nr:RNA recognition motif domain containing protein [Babesia bovis T2Bo]EDO07024.1 RNA recognition motif domain containing protein [Babesia bovis T2Bo]BAN64950.1 RNA recognition motif containing protein [Babesia bovis]|eukprot:XP_001610592.1 RNA recognition motif containing protein [Babesia bovis T2Bo]